MRVHCDINLRNPSDGNFLTGSILSGVVRYTIDEEIVFTNISVSLKGRGYLEVHNTRKNEADGLTKDEEEYLSVDLTILNDENGQTLPVDIYDTQFDFQLPIDMPPSVDFVKSSGSHTVRCKINYYLQMIFENSEGSSVRFSTTINVVPGVNPKLSTEPRIYDKQRKLIQLLRDSFVTLKATIMNPIVTPTDKAELVCEIFNDTNVNFKCVESKLIEVTSFPRGYYDSDFSYEIFTDVMAAGIKSGDSETINVEIPIPKDVYSIENSNLIYRDYYVKITVYLPLPYRNVTLKVPLQIAGVTKENILDGDEAVTSWVAMEEDDVNSDECS